MIIYSFLLWLPLYLEYSSGGLVFTSDFTSPWSTAAKYTSQVGLQLSLLALKRPVVRRICHIVVIVNS